VAEDRGIRVYCYAGYRGEETPQRLKLGGNVLDVIEVVDRWLSPDHRYFKCLCSDGDSYIVRYDVQQDAWDVTYYQRAGA